MRGNWNKIIKSLFTTGVLLIPAIYFGYEGKPTEMGIIVVASAIALSFLNIDKIQKFKGAGFEAEMKKVVDEAYITIDNLKSVALPLIITTIDTITWGKRWGDSESGRNEKMFEELIAIIETLNLENDEIIGAIDEHYSLRILDQYSIFKEKYKEIEKQKGSLANELNDIEKSLNEIQDYKVCTFPSEEKILKVIGISKSDLSKEALEALDGYTSSLITIGEKITKLIILR